MDKKLQKLIENFNKKLDEAQTARSEVMDYLEEKYDIDTVAMYEMLESKDDWCYGINISGLEKIIG